MENCHGGILRYTEKRGVKGSRFLIHHNCVKSMPFFRIKVSKMHQNSWILAFSFLIPGHPSVSKGADIHNGVFFFFFCQNRDEFSPLGLQHILWRGHSKLSFWYFTVWRVTNYLQKQADSLHICLKSKVLCYHLHLS